MYVNDYKTKGGKLMRRDLKHIRHFMAISIALFLTVLTVLPVLAEEEKPSADFSVAVLSAYIWRGQELSRDSIVIQPSMTVSYKGFSGNLWGKGFGMLSVEGGYIYYGLDGCDDTQEIFLTLGLDTLLSPSLTVYRDFDTYEHWYFLLGISHAFEITERVSLELSGSVSYLLSKDDDAYPEIDSDGVSTGDEFENFHDGVISANLPIAVAKYITITPSLSYTFPLSSEASDEMEWRSKKGNDDNFIYGGVTVSMAF
jgi:hypothetical protein